MGRGIDRLDGGHDFLGERCKLAVDHQHAVGTGEHTDGAPLSLEHEEIAGQLRRLDLDLGEVLLGISGGCEHDREAQCDQRASCDLHGDPPSGRQHIS